ncbi:MAG: VIT1/CCC1 transporter family protein [Thermoplasmata archaeon]|nr:VIT1/CCC1 transporter family protein [Thermoplasmata archaeon]
MTVEEHSHHSFLSDFILGSQDGLVNVLGILLGLTAAATGLRLILIATFAALGAESISMGAVAYTSTRARRQLYLSESQREQREMRELPDQERAEVASILTGWGLSGAEQDDLLDRICRHPRVMLEFMMAFELGLSPVAEDAPRKSGLLVGTATVVGSLVPVLPFLAFPADLRVAILISVVLSAAALFAIGVYEAKTTIGSLWKSGLRMAVIGLVAGLAGFLVGHFLGATPAL